MQKRPPHGENLALPLMLVCIVLKDFKAATAKTIFQFSPHFQISIIGISRIKSNYRFLKAKKVY